jgi:GNAT superfamily N-acetyltransferase
MITEIEGRDLRSYVCTGLVEGVYRDILSPSFGPDELDTMETVLEGLTEGGSYDAWGLCAFDGQTPVGCILGYPFPRSHVLLIGYLSVKPGFRGRGIGHILLDAARQRWYEKPNVALVLAEVEDPRCHRVEGDVDPERRATFYARQGAQVVVGPYFQPRLEGEGKRRVYHLFLTVLGGTREAISPKNSVPTGMLVDFIVDYFRESGEGRGWPSAADDEGNRLLDWYRGREAVVLHPMADYAGIDIPRISD